MAGPERLLFTTSERTVTGLGDARPVARRRAQSGIQLFDVLQGSMSLVDPRPHRASEFEQMPIEAKCRSLVTPSLTSLRQVSGRFDLEGNEALRLNLRPVESRSMTIDVLILRTTVFALARAGAR